MRWSGLVGTFLGLRGVRNDFLLISLFGGRIEWVEGKVSVMVGVRNALVLI